MSEQTKTKAEMVADHADKLVSYGVPMKEAQSIAEAKITKQLAAAKSAKAETSKAKADADADEKKGKK